MSNRTYFFTIALLVTALASGCSTNPPMQEMSDARQSVEAAETIGAKHHAPVAMNSAQQLLSRAESDMQTGAYEEAQKDAIAAREAARQALAITQAKHEVAVEELKPKMITITEPQTKPMQAPPPSNYTVQRKDNLWEIAALPSVYGDARLWPLLFKKNSEHIKKADLILPGQILSIDHNPNPREIDAAIEHSSQNRDAERQQDILYLRKYGLR
ncbi:DUF4398 domain-containing protein [Pseudomonadota bacterium]